MGIDILISQDYVHNNSPSVNIVIDVLRAFSTAVHAIEKGVERIQVLGDSHEGVLLKLNDPT